MAPEPADRPVDSREESGVTWFKTVKRQPPLVIFLEAVVLLGGVYCAWETIMNAQLRLDVGLFWFLLGLTVGMGLENGRAVGREVGSRGSSSAPHV